jgi:nucleoside 2-deoxyribosyltransferase
MTDNNENLPRIYLAGPNVFRSNAKERGEELKKKLAEFGLQGVYPGDVYVEAATKLQVGYKLYEKNIELLKSCVGVLADITPFRSPSADVGTAFEMGYATAMGIPVVCYTFDTRKYYKERVSQDGNRIEDFSMVDNLMLHGSTGGAIYDKEALDYAISVLRKRVVDYMKKAPQQDPVNERRLLNEASGRLAMVNCELFGNPQMDPDDASDRRWSAALQRASTLRKQRDNLVRENDGLKIEVRTAGITIDRLQSENAQLHLRVNGLREELDRLNADYEVCKDERDRRRIAAHRAGRDDALIPDPSSWKNSEGHTCGLLLRWFDGSGNPRTVIADHSAVRAWLAHVSKENREAALQDYIPSQKQADTWMQERDELIARDQRAERLIERYSNHLDAVLRLASGIPVAQEDNEHASVHALRQLLDKYDRNMNELHALAERPWQSVEYAQRARANEEDLSRILDLASGCQVPKAPVEHAAVVAVRNMITRNNIDLDDRAITINTLRSSLEELKVGSGSAELQAAIHRAMQAESENARLHVDLMAVRRLATGSMVDAHKHEHEGVYDLRQMIARNQLEQLEYSKVIDGLRNTLEELKAQKKVDIVFGTFEWAILQLLQGHCIRRAEWRANVRVEKTARSVHLVQLETKDGVTIEWVPRHEDLKATDYEVFQMVM